MPQARGRVREPAGWTPRARGLARGFAFGDSPMSLDLQLNYLPRLPRRKDWRIGCVGAGFIMRDCHLLAYRQAGFNPVAIAARRDDQVREVARQHQIPRIHGSVEALLADRDVEIL